MKQRFDYGNVLIMQGVYKRGREDKEFMQFVHETLERHLLGDWGDIPKCDAEENERALIDGDNLISAYNYGGGRKNNVYIVTDADRSVTTILVPDN